MPSEAQYQQITKADLTCLLTAISLILGNRFQIILTASGTGIWFPVPLSNTSGTTCTCSFTMSKNLSLDITFLMSRSNIQSLVRYGNHIESLDQIRLILACATPAHSEASYQAREFPLDLSKVDQGAVFPHAHSHCTVSCPAWRTNLQVQISTSPLMASLLHPGHKWLFPNINSRRCMYRWHGLSRCCVWCWWQCRGSWH